MSVPLIGAIVGLAFAVAEYLMFGVLIRRAAAGGERGPGPRIFDMVRKLQLVFFPIAGFVAGRLLERYGVL